jgi:hypothetical protein
MKRELVVESSLEKGDFRKLTYWNMFGKNRLVPVIFAVFFIVGMLLIFLGGSNVQLKVGGMFAAASPFIALLIMEFNIMTVARRGNIEERTYGRYTITDIGIRADAEHLESPLIYNWRNIESVYETGDFYIIFINRIQTIIIRKTDLTDEKERILKAYLNENITGSRNHLNG